MTWRKRERAKQNKQTNKNALNNGMGKSPGDMTYFRENRRTTRESLSYETPRYRATLLTSVNGQGQTGQSPRTPTRYVKNIVNIPQLFVAHKKLCNKRVSR